MEKDNFVALSTDAILFDIYRLDCEFKEKLRNPSTSSNYFTEELLKKTEGINNRIALLGDDDKLDLFNKMEKFVNCPGNSEESLIIGSFYELVHYLKSRIRK